MVSMKVSIYKHIPYSALNDRWILFYGNHIPEKWAVSRESVKLEVNGELPGTDSEHGNYQCIFFSGQMKVTVLTIRQALH